MRINQNIMAYNAYRNLSSNETTLSKSLEKLSSGYRINRAADDAAGLTISQGLRAQVSGLRQATRNAQDGISVVQTAEGALNEVHNMLGRMRDLAVQAANTGSQDPAARDAAKKEVDELYGEINRIADTTKFGGTALLAGTYGNTAATGAIGFSANGKYTYTHDGGVANNNKFTVTLTGGNGAISVDMGAVDYANVTASQMASTLQTAIRAGLAVGGAGGNAVDWAASQNLTVTAASAGGTGTYFQIDVPGLANGGTWSIDPTGANTQTVLGAAVVASSATVAGSAKFQVGANASDTQISVTVGDMHASGTNLNLSGVGALVASGSTTAISTIDTAIAFVSTTRAQLGATQNRFESVISNLQVSTENLSASESRIRDVDYAQEMVTFTRGQILNQAATSMLGQANQLPQGVLSLLRG